MLLPSILAELDSLLLASFSASFLVILVAKLVPGTSVFRHLVTHLKKRSFVLPRISVRATEIKSVGNVDGWVHAARVKKKTEILLLGVFKSIRIAPDLALSIINNRNFRKYSTK